MSKILPRALRSYALLRNPATAPHLAPFSDTLFAQDDEEAVAKARTRARGMLRAPGYAPNDVISLNAFEDGRRHVGAWTLADLAS